MEILKWIFSQTQSRLVGIAILLLVLMVGHAYWSGGISYIPNEGWCFDYEKCSVLRAKAKSLTADFEGIQGATNYIIVPKCPPNWRQIAKLGMFGARKDMPTLEQLGFETGAPWKHVLYDWFYPRLCAKNRNP